MLYDARGEPVHTNELTRAQAEASWRGVRSPYRTSVAATLTPQRLGRLFREADDGSTEAYFTLCQEVEERDSHYDSVLRSRKQAVSGAEIHVESVSDKRQDRKIADAVRELVRQPAFEGLVFNALDALGKGISFNEIGWETDSNQWIPTSYTWTEQRFFTWDMETLSEPLLVSDEHPNGEALKPYKWVVHVPLLRSGPARRSGLSRSAITIYMLKSYTLRDWMAFIEVYGMPLRVGKYSDKATPEQIARLERAIHQLGSDAGGVIPESMKIEFIEKAKTTGGDSLYLGTAKFWNAELSKLVLGQTMTTEDGSSLGQAAVHERKELMINRADARGVCASIVRDLVTPFVRLNWGADAAVPNLKYIIRSSAEQTAFMKNVKTFVELGGEVEQSVVRDRIGLPDPPEPKKGEEPPKLLRPSNKAATKDASSSTDDTNTEADDTSTEDAGTGPKEEPKPKGS